MKLTQKEMVNMIQEIGLLRLHKSPNLVNCIEAFDHKSSAYIVMELMSHNITRLLNATELSENACKYILNEVLKGIQFMHSKHIIHRDIKSDNILYND